MLADFNLNEIFRQLPDLDVLSKSDPFCVVYTQPAGQQTWKEYGRTEIIWNTLNPDFATKFIMSYHFEEQQKLRFELYDADSNSQDLKEHDFIGWVDVTLGNLVSQCVIKNKIQFHNPYLDRGMLILMAEELVSNKDELQLQLIGHKLDKKNSWFGQSNPFIVISKATEATLANYVVVHKTEVVKRSVNPVWKAFSIPVRNLCNGDYDRTLKLECYSWKSNGSHTIIGESFTSLQKLLAQAEGGTFSIPLNNQKKARKKSDYIDSGKLEIVICKLGKVYSFLDFIQGGTEILCTIAIDFTASNGNPNDPRSLHYMGPGRTKYEDALISVGNIIQDYDTDKQFPVLGFGAKMSDGRVSHEFFVNMNPTSPYCNGIPEVVAAYRSCLTQVTLYGPTNFAPVIRHITKFAQQYPNGTHYFILLILTDGVITDMYDTKEAIVEASTLPLSIIIIGIGQADFDSMEELDSDNVQLTAPSGRKAARDIVQFVAMREVHSTLELTREVLREIPDQLVGFMKSRNIAPKPPRYGLDSLPPDPEQLN